MNTCNMSINVWPFSSRFLIVLACLILSVLSTIGEYQHLAYQALYWVVSLTFHPPSRKTLMDNLFVIVDSIPKR